MRILLSIFMLLSLPGIVLSDQCAYVTQKQAELAAALLTVNPSYISYCEPCKDTSGKTIHVNVAQAKAVGYEEYWGLFADGKNVDLAYAYIDIGESKAVSLAKLTGCPVANTPGLIENPEEIPPEASAPPRKADVSPESQLVAKADEYFRYNEFASAVRMYEEAARSDSELAPKLEDRIIKCYYNLGVIQLRQEKCDMAQDYFRQVMFIDEKDTPARNALDLSRRCKEEGPTTSVKKAVALLEFRK